MVCCIYKDVDYLTLSTFREEVQAALWKVFLKTQKVDRYEGLAKFPDKLSDVPGLAHLAPSKRAETPPPSTSRRKVSSSEAAASESPPRQRPISSRLQVPTSVEAMAHDVLETALSNGASWPFKAPVDVNVAPDYYQVIRNPMDISTMKAKNAKGEYRSLRDLKDDFKLMFENCIFYNGDDSIYAQAAQVLEKVVTQRIERLEQMARANR
jgi:hypothetical protein